MMMHIVGRPGRVNKFKTTKMETDYNYFEN
jgi:hypothetical protein